MKGAWHRTRRKHHRTWRKSSISSRKSIISIAAYQRRNGANINISVASYENIEGSGVYERKSGRQHS